MLGQRRIILDRVETDYLRSQIDSSKNVRIKNALQIICKSYRNGFRVNPSQLIGIVNSVTATAFRPTIDEKVRRWVLNALARIGDHDTCLPAVLYLIKKYPYEPDTIAAGIAAVYKLCVRTDPEIALAGINFDPKMRMLAALQHVPADKLDLRELPLNADRMTPDLLKLALIVIGLDRSPECLLNPRHSNSEMVKALGTHHDPVVSQYSVWAITENNKLGLWDLGIDLKNIENQPDNVRGWLFRLVGIEATASKSNWEYVVLGTRDPSFEARKGLAIGLQNTFVDVFEPIVLEWVISEPDVEVRQHIMDHIVRQAHRSERYTTYAVEIYDGEPPESLLRKSMEASAARTPIYTRFRQIGAGSDSLFGGVTMVKNQWNIGTINGGAVAVGESEAINNGETNIYSLSEQQILTVQSELAKLEAAVHELCVLTKEKKQEALRYISEAKIDPSPSRIGKVISFIGHLGTIAEVGTLLAPYVTALSVAIAGAVGF